MGEDGELWSSKTAPHPRQFRSPPDTQAWQVGQIALFSHIVTAYPASPPQDVQVMLTLFDRERLHPLPARNHPPGAFPITQLTLDQPNQPANPNELSILTRLDATFDEIILLGTNLDRTEARPGEPFHATFFWQAGEQIATDYSSQMQLVDSAGNIRFEREMPPF